ncbi:AgmX/PglI C-terminal domain-containing protein [Marinibactrum halimedae]|uniref:AgmX/PglI C-terminal domain-containing protein n=1 Tax=Marinibactrum halimedae TaxID=1444977 RepID=A0AA37T5F5_9GAMM|nr:AgmX/PglI C-terminal domain-containing protein [Marinibactrum halimedae]MCD9457437.1 AgmX/PglI C-terminal domain-containing protein [Marinibactrum halimedae]GLS25513.1 hypothetical protein GCM10007877_12270 [Marinibactrum halimedae]
MIAQPLSPDLVLPWTPDEAQEQAFQRWVKRTLIALLVVFIIIPFLPVFDTDLTPEEKTVVKTKVILKPVEVPPPPVVEQKPKPVPKPPKPKKPEPKPEPPKKKPEAKPEPKPAPKPVTAKEAVQKTARLSEVSAQLNALKGALNVAGLKKKEAVTREKGVVATANRNILGENRASQASFGNAVDETAILVEAAQLTSHEVTAVKGEVTGGTEVTARSHGSYVSGQRDMESIRRVFESHKSSVYALYNEALNQYPELEGKFIFRLVIEPNGGVRDLKIVASELNVTPELERKILRRIRGIQFGAEDVVATSVEYKFVFFPS